MTNRTVLTRGIDMEGRHEHPGVSTRTVEEELYAFNPEYQRKIGELTELTHALEGIPDGVYFKDTEGRYTRINAAYARRLGLADPNDAVGKRDDELLDSDAARASHLEDQRIIESGRPVINQEEEERDADGKTRWFLATRIPLRGPDDPDGPVTGTFGILREITEIKRVEQALRDNERKLTGILALVPDQIRILDRDYNVIWSNDVARCRLGMDPTGRKCYSLCNGRTVPCETCPAERVFAQGDPCELERTCVFADGSKRTHWCIINPASLDEQGRPETVIEVVHDVTDYHRAQEAERRLERERLDSLLFLCRMAAAPIEAIQEFALREAVRHTNSRIGYVAFVNEDKTIQSVQSWTQEPADAEIGDGEETPDLKELGEPWNEVIRRRRPVIKDDYAGANAADDSSKPARVRHEMHVPVLDGDRIAAVAGAAGKGGEYDEYDIRQLTLLMQSMWLLLQQRRSEETIKKAYDDLERRVEERTVELRRSNDELEQFAYVASHDLKEPLRMVSSYVKLLAEEYAGKLDDEADKFIAYAVDGAIRMQDLIDDLLEFSRVGKSQDDLCSVDMGNVVRRAVADLESAVRESDAQIDVGPMPTVVGREAVLVQLMQNLISNAIKFRGENRPLVKIRAVSRDCEQEIIVEDNGLGIQPEFHERIFRLFQRLHARNEYPGTGIGLAVCRKIVEHRGGRIWVESEPGHGAAFHFTVPNQTVPAVGTGPEPALVF